MSKKAIHIQKGHNKTASKIIQNFKLPSATVESWEQLSADSRTEVKLMDGNDTGRNSNTNTINQQ